jgi:hypothetical protein
MKGRASALASVLFLFPAVVRLDLQAIPGSPPVGRQNGSPAITFERAAILRVLDRGENSLRGTSRGKQTMSSEAGNVSNGSSKPPPF